MEPDESISDRSLRCSAAFLGSTRNRRLLQTDRVEKLAEVITYIFIEISRFYD